MIDDFKWEEIEIEDSNRGGKTPHNALYIYESADKKQTQVKALKEHLENAGIHDGDTLKLYGQGKAIFMMKLDKYGNIGVRLPDGGSYAILGKSTLAKRLRLTAETMEFEVLEAQDGYILFRPIR